MDQSGKLNLKKTGGLTATMVDIVKAVQNQDVFMIHIVDAIQATNLDHMGSDMAKKEAEGLVFAGLDPVATDLLCARYMFSNVPLKEALEVKIDDGAGGVLPSGRSLTDRWKETISLPEKDMIVPWRAITVLNRPK